MLGITLSHPHLRWLGIAPKFAIEQLAKHSFSYVRLGSYWSEIEKTRVTYDYQALEEWLHFFEHRRQSVVLTVGIKAPRWPEFYYPEFIMHKNTRNSETQKAILDFIRQTVKTLQKYKCISHWQIENEPFDQSGPAHEQVDLKLLEQEVILVRQLDQRPILLTLWGNALRRRGFLPQAMELADVVGIDLYYRQFARQVFGQNLYVGPESESTLQRSIRQSYKPIWITELQAEPWERDAAGYLGEQPASMSPQLLEQNLARASRLGVSEILLWGFEYWLYRSQQGDHRYLEIVDRHNQVHA